MITDPYESTNLASSMPQYTAELTSMLDNYLAAVDASMPYDIKTPVHLRWDASAPGVDPKGWRSTIDVNYKGRETWSLGAGAEQPTAVNMAAFQPGLPDRAFAFDGGDIMRHVFFNVGDKLPRYLGITNMTMGTADFDRSASLSTWFRTSALNRNQVLFESGDGSSGMSLTLGNADGNGGFNDLRLRVRSADGTAYDVTAPIDKFANPTADFVNATAVINDSTTNRYLELYINGAVAARLDLPTGDASSINWDGFDQAGLGRAANGLGGAAGSGNLPFNGGFVGQMAAVSFYNYALNQSTVAGNYNAMLDPVGLGVQARTGEIVVPTARATDLRPGAAESDSLLVMEERRGVTAAPLSVSAVVAAGVSSHYAAPGAPQQLASGAEFTSYLMHFDPLANTPGLQTVTGSVTFAEEILAIVYDGGLLSASDAALGAIGNYGTTGDRGLAWSPGDFLSVDANQRTLSFNLTIAGDDLLQFRVLTGAVSPAGGADFNNDGIVDGADLAAWTAAYGASPNADADGDGDSDGSDFLQWQRDLGAGSSTTAAAAVPEPAAMAMLAVAAFAGAAVSRRRRS
jgi:hypothetical protein